jgi:hypothetical protein
MPFRRAACKLRNATRSLDSHSYRRVGHLARCCTYPANVAAPMRHAWWHRGTDGRHARDATHGWRCRNAERRWSPWDTVARDRYHLYLSQRLLLRTAGARSGFRARERGRQRHSRILDRRTVMRCEHPRCDDALRAPVRPRPSNSCIDLTRFSAAPIVYDVPALEHGRDVRTSSNT